MLLTKAARIRKYILVPQHKRPKYYIHSGDTTAVALFEQVGYGIFYSGHGHTDHSRSTYQVVYVCKKNLWFFNHEASLKSQQMVLNQFFQRIGTSKNNPERQRVTAKITYLMKQNQRPAFTDVF